MSDTSLPFTGEQALEDLIELNYKGAEAFDLMEGSILSEEELGSSSTPGYIATNGGLVSKFDFPFLFKEIGYTYSDIELEETNSDFFALPNIPFHYIKWSPMVNPFVLQNLQAVKATIKMYLLSQPSDYNRAMTEGGVLQEFIKKSMDDLHEDLIIAKLTEVMKRFETLITHDIKVVRELTTKTWLISISYSDLLNKYTTNTQLAIEG